MKSFIDDLIYGIGQGFLILFYILYFIFSWILAIIVVPLLITYWFILKLFNKNTGKLSNIIRIHFRKK